VRGVGIVRETVAACVGLAAIAFLAGAVLGQMPVGAGLALGLSVGALNGELIRRVVASSSPFVVSSIVRMALLSALAILIAFALSASPVAVLLGVAAAQVVMVAVAVRQGLRT
jgi:hypothetical protein